MHENVKKPLGNDPPSAGRGGGARARSERIESKFNKTQMASSRPNAIFFIKFSTTKNLIEFL